MKHKHKYETYCWDSAYVPIDQTGEFRRCKCGKYEPLFLNKDWIIVILLLAIIVWGILFSNSYL